VLLVLHRTTFYFGLMVLFCCRPHPSDENVHGILIYFLLHYIIWTSVFPCICQDFQISHLLSTRWTTLFPIFKYCLKSCLIYLVHLLFSCSYECITQIARCPDYRIMLRSRYLYQLVKLLDGTGWRLSGGLRLFMPRESEPLTLMSSPSGLHEPWKR